MGQSDASDPSRLYRQQSQGACIPGAPSTEQMIAQQQGGARLQNSMREPPLSHMREASRKGEDAEGGQNDPGGWGGGGVPQAQFLSQGPPGGSNLGGGGFHQDQRPVQNWPAGGAGTWNGPGFWIPHGNVQWTNDGLKAGNWSAGGQEGHEYAPPRAQSGALHSTSEPQSSQMGGRYGVGQRGGGPGGPEQAPPRRYWQEPPRERRPPTDESCGFGQKQVELQEERRVPEAPSWNDSGQHAARGHGLVSSQRGGRGLSEGQQRAGYHHGRGSGRGSESGGWEAPASGGLQRGVSLGGNYQSSAAETGAPQGENTNPQSQESDHPQHSDMWSHQQRPGTRDWQQAPEAATWQQRADVSGSWRAQPSFPEPEYRPQSSGGLPSGASASWPRFPGYPGFGAPPFGLGGFAQLSSQGFEQPPQVAPPARPDAGRIVAETFEMLKKDMLWPPQWEAYRQAAANLAMASGFAPGPQGFGGMGFPFGGFPSFGGPQLGQMNPPREEAVLPKSLEGTVRERPDTPEWSEDAGHRAPMEEARSYQSARPPSGGQVWRGPADIRERSRTQSDWGQGQGDRRWERTEGNAGGGLERRGEYEDPGLRASGGAPANRRPASGSRQTEEVSEERNVLRMQGGSAAGVSAGGEKRKQHGGGFDLNLDLNLSVSGSEEGERFQASEETNRFRPSENDGRNGRDPDAEVREHLQAGKRNARLEEEGRRQEAQRRSEERETGEHWQARGGEEREGRAHSEPGSRGGWWSK